MLSTTTGELPQASSRSQEKCLGSTPRSQGKFLPRSQGACLGTPIIPGQGIPAFPHDPRLAAALPFASCAAGSELCSLCGLVAILSDLASLALMHGVHVASQRFADHGIARSTRKFCCGLLHRASISGSSVPRHRSKFEQLKGLSVVPAVAWCLPIHDPTMGFSRFPRKVFCPMVFVVSDDKLPVSHEKHVPDGCVRDGMVLYVSRIDCIL